jgi:stage V sporulation protein G
VPPVIRAACGGDAPPPPPEFGDLVLTAVEKDGAEHTITLNGVIEITGVRLRRVAKGEALGMPGRGEYPDVKVEKGEEGRLAAALKAGATGTGGATLRVTGVEIRPHESGSLRAFAQVTFNDGLLTIGVRVIEGRSGLFVGMPSKKVDERYVDTVKIVERDLRRAVEDAVLAAYRREAGDTPAAAPAE